MMYNIFRPQRRKGDWILFLLTIPALLLILQLRDYWQISSVPEQFHKISGSRIDSVVTARNIPPDSVLIWRELVIDEVLITSLSHKLGVHNAQKYMDTTNALEYLYRIRFARTDPGQSVNFNLGSTASTSTRAEEDESGDNRYLLSIWCNRYGDIVGAREPVLGNLATKDSVSVFATMAANLPEHWRTRAHDWQMTLRSEDKIRFLAHIADEEHFTRQVRLSANRINGSSWMVKWEVLNSVRAEDKQGSGSQGIGILKIVLVIMNVCILIGFIAVCINRLLKKAVSLKLCFTVAVMVTIYIVLSASSVLQGNWILILILSIVYFIFVGFLLAGLPVAGLFSLARETFAEKFYTSLRLTRKPWTSHYVGRSILGGISVAVLSGLVFPLVYFGAGRLGIDGIFLDLIFSEEMQMLLAFRPSALAASLLLFVPIISVSSTLVIPVIAYRIIPKSGRFITALVGAILFSIIFGTMQSESMAYVTLTGILLGTGGFLLLYFYDILALVVYSLFYTMITFTPVFEAYSGIALLFGSITVVALLLGLKAYSTAPERVDEEDYKPSFLYTLEEEKRMKQELEAAKSVHQRLLPATLPRFPRVDIAASCVPAFEVGGDYYDVFQLDERRLGILIGDVSGKGMSAAFYITLAKGVIVSQVRQQGTPAEVMHRVNNLLYGVMERGKFISMIYAIFDTETNSLSYANAGHNPLVLRKAATGSAEIIPSKGMALGLDSGERFTNAVINHTMTLQENDTVVFYTDGVTEAMNSGVEEYSEERLLNTVADSAPEATTLVAAVLDSVNAFVGKAKQHDDITVVVLQVLAGERPQLT